MGAARILIQPQALRLRATGLGCGLPRIISWLCSTLAERVTAASGGMKKITPQSAPGASGRTATWADSEGGEDLPAPLSAEQARRWRTQHPQVSVGRALIAVGETNEDAITRLRSLFEGAS